LLNMENPRIILARFIDDNELKFDTTDSGLNSECIILGGFCDYMEIKHEDAIELFVGYVNRAEIEKEFTKAHKYAYENDYGAWWESGNARKMYKFTSI